MMRNVSDLFRHVRQLASMLLSLIVDAVCDLGLCLRPSPILAAENLFLRKQLALYQEHQVKLQQATSAIRLVMVWLSRVSGFCDSAERETSLRDLKRIGNVLQ